MLVIAKKRSFSFLNLLLASNLTICILASGNCQNKPEKSSYFGSSDTSGQSVFRGYLDAIRQEHEYSLIRSGLNDSLNSWIGRGLRPVLFFKHTNWKVDSAVFFDRKKEKAILLVLLVTKSDSFTMDYVKTIAAEKLNGKWNYYYVSYPVVDCRRANNNDLPFSFEALSVIGRNNIIHDGFITCIPDCHINYDYIDSGKIFVQWKRDMNRRFLQNALPTTSFTKPGEEME